MISYVTILRLIHILSAIFWVGTTLFMVGFLEPTVRASGPEGGKFMGRLIGGTRFSIVIAVAGWTTVMSGVLLYARYTNFDVLVMFQSRLLLTVGAIAGILAGIVGTTMQGRATGRIAAINRSLATGEIQPSSDVNVEVERLQKTIGRGSRISAVLMIIAVIGMVL